MDNIIQLRDVDRKRLDRLQEYTETPLANDDIWFIHTVLAQCFLPYRDPKPTIGHVKTEISALP
jgi:hypothetical protein